MKIFADYVSNASMPQSKSLLHMYYVLQKLLSEALILASINPKHDNRLFVES